MQSLRELVQERTGLLLVAEGRLGWPAVTGGR
jgi:hypothetical protein